MGQSTAITSNLGLLAPFTFGFMVTEVAVSVCSGFVSGGVCVFSRYPIIETMYQVYPLNGHAHKIFHGDWYGAKGCGLSVLRVKDFTVNLYSTHVSSLTRNQW